MTRLRFVRTWAAWGVLALAAVALPRAAAAATIAFDTFGPGDTFSTSVYGVDGAAGFQAFHFVPTATGTLEQITVALGRTGASQATTIFELYTAPTNLALGALLETFVVANTAPPDNLQPFTLSLVTFQSAVMPQLTAGQGYWLSFMEAEAADGASSLWAANSIGATDQRLTSLLPSQPSSLPAFRVEVTSVPEPATMVLLLGATLVVLRARRVL
ncbi:MAG: PEP-CTERM sorting domain-containing protein [Vicinamibacteraceae bacterium]|nr:PEP-CTERM sorting domain-containing protein [Vicinamibacteraceae bacterium]